MKPGKDSTEFKLLFSENWLKKGDVFIGEYPLCKLIVVKEPRLRDRWWWKILKFLTFGYFFQPVRYYTVKIYEKYEKS